MSGLTIASAQTVLPTPPTAWGVVPSTGSNAISNWHGVLEFDLELWATASTNLTAAELLGGTLQPQVLADDDVDTVDTTDNELDLASHVYETGDGPVRMTTTGVVPGGLAVATDYWVIKVSSGAIALAASWELAMAGTKIDLSAGASGTNTIVDTTATKRVHWHSQGLLGNAGDGAVTLTRSLSYRIRCKHSPRVVAYALKATLSAAEATTAALYPLPVR